MLPERNFVPSMVEVTLVLVTGKSHSGYLARFNPTAPDIALGLAQDAKAKRAFRCRRPSSSTLSNRSRRVEPAIRDTRRCDSLLPGRAVGHRDAR